MKQFSAKTKSSSFRLEECEEINVFKNILFFGKNVFTNIQLIYIEPRGLCIYIAIVHTINTTW